MARVRNPESCCGNCAYWLEDKEECCHAYPGLPTSPSNFCGEHPEFWMEDRRIKECEGCSKKRPDLLCLKGHGAKRSDDDKSSVPT